MSGSNGPLTPTYVGIVNSTKEALVLFEACLSGRLNHVPRRPHDRERKNLIQSGYIFIYEEHASGIKRWTDGINWSPSRILGNFLVYRELNGNVHPGEKKRALKNKASPTKRPSSNGGITKHSHSSSHSSLNAHQLSSSSFGADSWGSLGSDLADASMDPNQEPDDKDPVRQLVGSLTDSYDFKEPDGLVKKTISVKVRGVTHHLVNYYSIEHAMSGTLRRPWEDPRFTGIYIRPELYDQPGFRVPLGPDCYDEAGNGYVSNIVGSIPVDGRIQTQIAIPTQRQHHGSVQLDGFAQGNPTPHMGTLPTQLADQFHQLGSHFPAQLGGGYGMPIPTNYAPQTPASYQAHSSFDSQFDGHFGASPPNGTHFKLEPQDDAHPSFADHGFGTSHSLTNGDASYHLEEPSPFGVEYAGS